MLDLRKFWTEQDGVHWLVVGGVGLAEAYEGTDGRYRWRKLVPTFCMASIADTLPKAKAAAEAAVAEWLSPVLLAVLGEPVAWRCTRDFPCFDDGGVKTEETWTDTRLRLHEMDAKVDHELGWSVTSLYALKEAP